MFVHTKKAGLILIGRRGDFQKLSLPNLGTDLILQKKKQPFRVTHIFMHAVHLILGTIFTSLQTLYVSYKPLYLCTPKAPKLPTSFIFRTGNECH